MAVLSSLFILLAALTGLILSFEPIDREVNFASSKADIPVAHLLESISQYDEVMEVKIDEYGHTIASISHEDLDGEFYINPNDGSIIQEVPKQKWIFSFATTLHRSLFLKSTGRIIVAIVSLFLLLLTLTGIYLIIKRQNGFRNLFKKINKSNIREADYHTFLGRIQMIPIMIVTLTGITLSLIRFDIIKTETGDVRKIEANTLPKVNIIDMPIFKDTYLASVNTIEFPFSEDEEDYYYITLNGIKKSINQYTGQVIEIEPASSTYKLKSLSTLLHTGKESVIWSIILSTVCLGILYFIYSGFVISYKRLSTSVKNKISVSDAEYILLFGSENGQTKLLATLFLKALQQKGLKVFMLPLNEYRHFPVAKEIIIMTATYGNGEAPSNAKGFLEKLQHIQQSSVLEYSVLGFGSLAYKWYCQYAKEVTSALNNTPMMKPSLETEFINNANFNDYKNWVRLWGEKHDLNLSVKPPKQKLPKLTSLKVVDKNIVETEFGKTFTIRLQPNKKTRFVSGDLLAIYPKQDNLKRQYSIGKVGKDILLSIKIHDKGVCSQYLATLGIGDELKGKIERNKEFHYPKNKDVIMIANGTGIAPFIGMIHNVTSKQNILFWGGRNHAGYKLYESQIKTALNNKTLDKLYVAYSREGEKEYVQDIVHKNINLILEKLANNGVIMLCGSVQMQNDVFQILEVELSKMELNSIDYYKFKGQILTDCY